MRKGPVAAALGLLLLAGVWFVLARQRLRGLEDSSADRALEEATAVLKLHSASVQRELVTATQVLAEDARLKAMLATKDMDEGTVTDVLGDMKAQSEVDMLAALLPNGRVWAVIGANELRGIDLSGVAVVKQALAQPKAATAEWGFGPKLWAVAASAVRRDERVTVVVLVGRELPRDVVELVRGSTGVETALLSGDQVSQPDADAKALPVFTELAKNPGPVAPAEYPVAGATYKAVSVAITDRAPPLRFALAVPLVRSSEPLLLYGPLALAVALAAVALVAARRA